MLQDLSVNPLASAIVKLEQRKVSDMIKKAHEAMEDAMIAEEEARKREEYNLYKARKSEKEALLAQKEADRIHDIRMAEYRRDCRLAWQRHQPSHRYRR